MTAYQKAIEAAAIVLKRWCRFVSDRFNETDQYWNRRTEAIIIAFLARASQSGWEMKSRDWPYELISGAPEHNLKQAQAHLIWRNHVRRLPTFRGRALTTQWSRQ